MIFPEHQLCARACAYSCLTDKVKGNDNSADEKDVKDGDGDNSDFDDGGALRGIYAGSFLRGERLRASAGVERLGTFSQGGRLRQH